MGNLPVHALIDSKNLASMLKRKGKTAESDWLPSDGDDPIDYYWAIEDITRYNINKKIGEGDLVEIAIYGVLNGVISILFFEIINLLVI